MHPVLIVIHHSLTKDSGTVSWQAMRNYHLSKGFSDIGYHYGIEQINGRYEVLVGRGMNKTGAHTRHAGMNHKSLGICFVGNFDISEPPLAMWRVGVNFVRSLCQTLAIPPASVTGHRDYTSYKSCPGKFFDLGKFRADLAKG
jgi:N-acetyl-anhydromuramyl-L-alanine amidase AmpD